MHTLCCFHEVQLGPKPRTPCLGPADSCMRSMERSCNQADTALPPQIHAHALRRGRGAPFALTRAVGTWNLAPACTRSSLARPMGCPRTRAASSGAMVARVATGVGDTVALVGSPSCAASMLCARISDVATN